MYFVLAPDTYLQRRWTSQAVVPNCWVPHQLVPLLLFVSSSVNGNGWLFRT